MAKPILLASKTQLVIHNSQIYTVAEVDSADYSRLPPGAFVFLAQSRRGGSYYSEREKAMLLQNYPGETCAVCIERNDLANDGPLVITHKHDATLDRGEIGLLKRSISRIFFPLSVAPLPTL
ncbi:hypothetical protein HER32_14300 [Hymenobacter sp. BT18]|uniref:hypothetical protein n=1 Tax=Hymenobacter sp. BT18 TaxID=2835648 RepID=UPI00143EE8C6|nr:hypothetical protein [Hymenobacter sp. BT18]QIX62285.1 hypothetical protein HER32_14300 [Hymenobacter sp. BT18]